METQSQGPDHLIPRSEFEVGTPVIYGLHGKCSIIAIETRRIGQQTIRGYRLEVTKSALSRSSRREPSIWIPIEAAHAHGMRTPISSPAESDAIFAILGNREYYFSSHESWSTVYPKLEATIRNEGALGLAKVLSYLHVLKRRQVVPTPELNRFYETVSRLLFRELSEFLAIPIRTVEERTQKSLRHKQMLDQ